MLGKYNTNEVDLFIATHDLPTQIAKGVLQSLEDCFAYLDGFHLKGISVADDLLDFREQKIEQSNITLSDFLEKVRVGDLQEVFQETFFQSFSFEEMQIIKSAICSGATSYQSIFKGFQSNPNKNILKYVQSARIGVGQNT